MSSTTATISPLRDDSRPRRFKKLIGWAVALIVILVICRIAGVDVIGWLESVWDQITAIPVGYLVAGLFFQTVQTMFTALAWLGILRPAYPAVKIQYRAILAAYAVSVALNGFLPANMGTFVLLLMLVALIPGATFPGILAAYLVEKIFFTVIMVPVYLYLFASNDTMPVRGSHSPDFSKLKAHPVLTIVIVGGAVFLLILLCRALWGKLKKLWNNAKVGGAVLSTPRRYFTRVFTPSLLGWIAKLAVIGIFLAAYGIPVTFHTIMSVVGSNSIANTVSVTPGGVGVNQAMNVAALGGVTSASTATAYSLGQQLITTAWNQVFAIALVIWVFGWTGGKALVTESYSGAKEKAQEQREQRREKKEERRAERDASGETALRRMRGRLRREDPNRKPPDGGDGET